MRVVESDTKYGGNVPEHRDRDTRGTTQDRAVSGDGHEMVLCLPSSKMAPVPVAVRWQRCKGVPGGR